MAFFTEPEPERGVASRVAPDIWRMVANNPSKMTYHGTNTYLVDTPEGWFVIDPGPAGDDTHFKALLGFLSGQSIGGILLSHHHSDHIGAVPRLRTALRVPVHAYGNFSDDALIPDAYLRDGERVAGMEVLHTPGHASDHLCFAHGDGVLFTGDHIMTWNSSIVSPPDGNMADYCAQLERVIARKDKLILPGHGPVLNDPVPHTERLLSKRVRRENAILEALRDGPMTVATLSATLYRKADPHIAQAAERNAEAHLIKLAQDGLVTKGPEGWQAT